MSNVYGIDVSALEAFQQAIAVTSNNVANASTPGYDEESIQLAAAIPQTIGSAPVGTGVVVTGVSRAFNQAAETQLNTSQSNLGQLNAVQNYTSQIDNLFGTTAGGLSTTLQAYYGAWSSVANDPTSTAARQALLGASQNLASTFQTTSSELESLNSDVNTRISADVQQINAIGVSIANLNQQIVTSTAEASGQPPNVLLGQRDQLVTNLSQLVGVTTTTDSNGSLNVFVGNGQPLVLQSGTTTLTTVANQFDAAQLEVSNSTANGAPISASITSGDLGGLLAARSQVINPALNQLGQVAAALTQSANAQQNAGLDLTGQFGANLFSVGAPEVSPSSRNTDGTTAAASVANVGGLTADNYVLAYHAGAYTLTDQTTGASVPLAGAGTIASPLTGAGLSIVLSGTPAAGDQFLIQPTSQAAATFQVALTNPSQVAAAGAIQTEAADTNTGNAAISAGTVQNAANPNLLATATIQFTTPTTYSVDGTGSYAYTSGGNISQNGWQVQISGTPATGDVFTVKSNVGATGDNGNALAAAKQQTQGVLNSGTTSISGAVSGLITSIGSQAQQINTAQTAQTAVNTTAQSNVQSVTGVNLDEEAANLLQWQQAYQAAAQALTVANSLFTSLLDSINGTYS